MGGSSKPHASIQTYPPHTPTPIGDGFTTQEIQDALQSQPSATDPWTPPSEYAECAIADLQPGPRAVTFMGRVANVFDVGHSPKTPRSARGCVKVCVRDCGGAVTVSCWTWWRVARSGRTD